MTFQTRTMTKDLESIPFDRAFRLCEEAVDLAISTQEAIIEQEFEEKIQALEREYTSQHEAPSEVSFADQVDRRTYDKPALRRAVRQRTIAEEFIPQYKLKTILQTFVMPQIVRWITRGYSHQWLAEVSAVSGQIDGLKAVKRIFDFSREWDRGLYYFLMMDSRSAYLTTQYKGEARAYCALVPLIMYAFKLHHSIPYSQWDPGTVNWVAPHGLAQAMTAVPPDLTRDELIEIREQGLLYRGGAKVGTSRKPQSTHKLYGIQNTALGKCPELQQVMLAQIWCAHPQNRTKYMILDPNNWDNIPTPLIVEDIFSPTISQSSLSKNSKEVGATELPWDA